MPTNDAYRTLAVEIERVRAEVQSADGRITGHEELCAERYDGIKSALDDLKKDQGLLRSDLQGIAKGAAVLKVETGSRIKDVQVWALTAVLAVLIGLCSFTAKELYSINRAAAEHAADLTHAK